MKNERLPAIDVKVKQPPVLFSKTQARCSRMEGKGRAGTEGSATAKND